ncbi:MAG: tRNA-intron lyase [Thermoproteota archaeon]|nr:tRNA-intron lyase [Thermoproteota archaeon]
MSSQPSSAQPFSDKVSELTETPAVEQSIIEGRLEGNGKIVIGDSRFQDELRTKGFGDKEESEYVLKPYEALYLLYSNRLRVNNEPNITFRCLFERLLKHNRNIMNEFLVYRDLRSRGYVAKEGFGFGNDFRVYERGTYQKKPAKYVVFGINEGTNTTAKGFATAVEQIQKMGKEAVVAVIERRGEVIYYKASKIRFVQNKYSSDVRDKG